MGNDKLKYPVLVEEIKNRCPWKLMKNSINEETIFYHLCKNNPPTEEDFKPHAYSNIPQRKGKYKKILKNFKKSKNSLKIQINLCLSFGISVYLDKNDIINLQKNIPQIGNFIASLKINPLEHGKVYNTPTNHASHCTWFPFKNVDFKQLIQSIYI